MAKTISGRVQMRIDTLANWQSANPTLLLNEVVGEIQEDNTTIKFKRGDGSTAYNTLGYIGIPGPNDDADPANKEYVDNQITSASVETLGAVIRKDGTSTTTAQIPFAQGISVSGNSAFDGPVTVQTPTENEHAANKSYVDNAIEEATSGNASGVKIVEVTIPTGSWTAYGDSGKAWQYTVSNAAFEANDYVSIDASVDEIVSHLSDTPITSLTASRATAGSCTVYAVSDEAPDAQYSIQLIVHKVVA